MPTELTDRPSNGYDEETFNLILTVLAMHGGNGKNASAHLKEHHDIQVSERSLYRYAHCDRYHTVRAEILPQINEQVAQQAENAALIAHQKELELYSQLDPEQLEQKDIPKAIKFLTDSKATNIDKARLLRDKPTQIVKHQDADEILRKLAGTGVVQVIDSTATDETQAHPSPPQLASVTETGAHAQVQGEPAELPAQGPGHSD